MLHKKKRLFAAVFFTYSLMTCFSISMAAEYYVSLSGSDAAVGSTSAPWGTLQHAADVVGPGDIVIIRNGTYAGLKAKSGGTSGAPITFKEEEGANVIINTVSPDSLKGSIVEIENHDWWVLDGLEITGAPGNAGIDIRVADHVMVLNCHCHHNRKWGIFTAFADYFTAEHNECSYSIEEHGIYHSNSGDTAVIRFNVCHHNNAGGIQINADPSMGDDGISSNCIVTHNVLYENGTIGGAAINLASVRDSLFSNNLIYSNHAGGIAAWDDDQGHQWGSKNNSYYNNTIHMPSDGRWAINLGNGSTGSRVYNNILIHENSARGGLEIDTSSLTGFSSDYNILSRISVDESTISLSTWQSDYSRDGNSFSRTAAQTFVSQGSDYRLLDTAIAVDRGKVLLEILDDLDGNARPQGGGYDMGAYEHTPSDPCPNCSDNEAVIENITFPSGTTCECVSSTSITIGSGVVVQIGATVTFKAPIVRVNPEFHGDKGSIIYIKQQ